MKVDVGLQMSLLVSSWGNSFTASPPLGSSGNTVRAPGLYMTPQAHWTFTQRDQQAKRGVTSLAGVAVTDDQEETGCFYNT